MSYQPSHNRSRVPRHALSGDMADAIAWGNDLWNSINKKPPPTGEQQCWNKANQQVAALDNQRSDVNKNWTPSGFYTPQQLDALVNTTYTMMRKATAAHDSARTEAMAQGDRDALNMQRTDLQKRFDEGLKFVSAIQQARASGISIIDAPGLKRWIVNAMGDSSALIFGVHYVLCMRPWFVGALQTYMIAFNAVYSVVQTVVGVAIDVVKAAGSAVLRVPDTIATVVKVAKWGVIGTALYLLYKGEHKKILAKL